MAAVFLGAVSYLDAMRSRRRETQVEPPGQDLSAEV